MQYVNLGASGLVISRLGLGMMTYGSSAWRPWTLDEDASRPVVRRAVELGINFFDTADMYSGGESEVLTGKLLREYMSAVSKKLIPSSTARRTTGRDASSSSVHGRHAEVP